MILEKLIIENFRPFRGTQEIVFSTLPKKNVTLIHAENGFGKTALLNALLWGFYGHDGLTPDLEKPERNIHEGLAVDCPDPNLLETRVTILFEDEGEKFTLNRSITLAQERADHKKTHLELEVLRDGATIRINRAKDKILSIMPQGISGFLFFNGERIDHLAMDRNAGQITLAIKQMLGLKLLQTTLDDLDHQNVRGRLNRELSENTDEETVQLIERQEELEKALAALREKRANCLSEQAAAQQEIKGIDAKLEANQRTRELQRLRNQLESEKAEQEQVRSEVSRRLSDTIADRGYMLFAEDLVTRGKAITGRLRGEEKIPARVLTSFVEDLLSAHRCICGCELAEDSPEFLRVQSLLDRAGDSRFNEAVSTLDHAIGAIESTVAPTREAIQEDARVRSAATLRTLELEFTY